ncbi:unnamed protein product [Gordionus sp. m RMFG-2023]|uniref:ELAV-like protein 3 n=1 Tax=Gordionus sp. m RMFG-2023 TaxID=3053472 RepID=UPI0030E12CEE
MDSPGVNVSSNNSQSSQSYHNGGSFDLDAHAKTNLIVNYLPQTMTQEEMKSLFQSVGEVDSCKLIKDKATGQSLGYGFVNYTKEANAEKAINTLNSLKLQNKTIKVSFARPSSEFIKGANLYVAGLPKHWSQPELENLFSEFGKIITSRILCDNMSGLSKGVGFVRFDQRNEAEKSIQKLNGCIPDSATSPLTVKFANNPAQGSKGAQQIQSLATNINSLNRNRMQGPIHSTPGRFSSMFRYSPMGPGADPNNTAAALLSNPLIPGGPSGGGPGGPGPQCPQNWCVFAYNLPPETEDSTLWQLFGPFGAVTSVKVIRDSQTHKCKGFGFINMPNFDEALMSIQTLNGYALGNRVLQVSFKTNKRA